MTKIKCPECYEIMRPRVINSRITEDGTCIRRRRVCPACGHRWTTKERWDEEDT